MALSHLWDGLWSALALQAEVSPLEFPDESDEEMTDRVHDDVSETKREADVGDAWASLEHNVLTNELSESE